MYIPETMKPYQNLAKVAGGNQIVRCNICSKWLALCNVPHRPQGPHLPCHSTQWSVFGCKCYLCVVDMMIDVGNIRSGDLQNIYMAARHQLECQYCGSYECFLYWRETNCLLGT